MLLSQGTRSLAWKGKLQANLYHKGHHATTRTVSFPRCLHRTAEVLGFQRQESRTKRLLGGSAFLSSPFSSSSPPPPLLLFPSPPPPFTRVCFQKEKEPVRSLCCIGESVHSGVLSSIVSCVSWNAATIFGGTPLPFLLGTSRLRNHIDLMRS